MFKLAEMFVDIRADQAPFDRALTGVRGQLSTTNVAVGSFLGNIAASVARAAVSLGGMLFEKTIKSASDMGETMSKVGVIMGSSAGIIIAESDRMAAKFGTNKKEYIDAASSFGAIFKETGTSQKDAAALGNQLAKLGMDMASFNNTTDASAFEGLMAAFRGEFDTIEKFNIFLSASAVSQEAMRMGLIKSSSEMTQQAKQAATLSLILKKTGDQQGDLDRTAGGTANRMRLFTGTMENLGTSIGQALMPAFDQLMSIGIPALQSLGTWFEGSKEMFTGWGESMAGALSMATMMVMNWPQTLQLVRIGAAEAIQNMIAWFEVLPANAKLIGEYFANNWSKLIVDGVNAALAAFTNFALNLENLGKALGKFLTDPTAGFDFKFTPLLTGFKATADALPEMIKPAYVSMQAEMDKVAADMVAKTATVPTKSSAAVAAAGSKTPGKPGTPGGPPITPTKEEAPKLVDTASFATDLISAQFGGSDAKKQLEATEATAKNTEGIIEWLTKIEKKSGAVFA